MKIISGASNLPFATSLAKFLKQDLIVPEITTFANGERRVLIDEPIKNQHIILVQSFTQPVDTHIIEYLLLADAIDRLGAKEITAVIPWLGYSMQDKVFRDGEPLAAKVIANAISQTFTHQIFLFDLHNSSIPGFFSKPTYLLNGTKFFAQYIRQNFDLKKSVVASPDFGGLKRARQFASLLDVPLINIDKHRDLSTGKVTAVGLHGEAKNKTVLLYDDVILSGGTALETAKLLKAEGAKHVHFLASHGQFVGAAMENLADPALDSIVVTNSCQYQDTLLPKITQLDVAELFGQELL